MRHIRGIAFLFFAVTLAVVPASAMEFKWMTTPATKDTSEGHYIEMSGTINKGDYETFRLFVRQNLENYKKSRYVYLSSNGGNLVEAIKIAGLLRSMYATIHVKDGKCASSCFFLYLSGSTRQVFSPLSLGIHRAYFDPKYFAALKPAEARKQQLELTKAVSSFLDDNGVPQYLRDVMNGTASNDIYWLSADDVKAVGEHPAWYEELMIAKCDYATTIKLRGEVRLKIQKGEDVEDSLMAGFVRSIIKYESCEKKLVDVELSNLADSLVRGKP